MNIKLLAIGLALFGLSGLATANPAVADESAFTVDLKAATGHKYFLKCSRSASLADCGTISVWQDTNVLEGLQSGPTSMGSRRYDGDQRLLL